jgi:hypothetical protein
MGSRILKETMMTFTPSQRAPAARRLHLLLWLAQWFIALAFVAGAWLKLTTPIMELAALWPWTGDLPASLVRLLGMIDLAGGLGVVLPALLRMRPQWTVTAAIGCAALQLCAMAFHATRGELAALPVNLVLLGVAAFIVWGRATRVAS